MAYTINLTNGNLFATIPDGTINTTSSMTLIGKNYAGYGQFLDDNFIHLLENSSNSTSPAAPLTGQLWWDSTNKIMKAWNGGPTWKAMAFSTASSSAPTGNNTTGDLWWDSTNAQLNVWDGAQWYVIGPAYTPGQGVTGAVPLSITAVDTNTYTVTGIYSLGQLVAIVNPGNDFVPQSSTYSTPFPTVFRGYTVWQSGRNAGNVVNNGNVYITAGAASNAAANATITVTTTGANVTGYLTASGNARAGNILTVGLISATGNITGNFILGNGSLLTGLSASKIFNGTSEANIGTSGGNANISIGGVSNVVVVTSTGINITGTVIGTGNITGGNILTGGLISATGAITSVANITGGNILTGGTVSSTGNITAPNFIGNVVGNISGNLNAPGSNTQVIFNDNNVANAVAGFTFDKISSLLSTPLLSLNSSNVTGAVITNAGGNGVGNIGSSAGYFNVLHTRSVLASGNITGGNVLTGGLVSSTGNITGGNLITSGVLSAGSTVVSGTESVTGNITGGNILTGGLISATGNITTSGSFIGTFAGNISGNLTVPGSNTQVIYNNSGNAGASSNFTFNSATNVMTVGGSLVGAVLSVNTGNTSGTVIVNAGGNGVGNIGSPTGYFNVIHAIAMKANYADIAERFAADEYLAPGTVVELGGSAEITKSRSDLSEEVFGVISTRAAYLMNNGAGSDETHPPVAMTGRVPVQCIGIVRKGDRLVSAGNGLARSALPGEATPFNTIGRALVAKLTEESELVEAIVTIK